MRAEPAVARGAAMKGSVVRSSFKIQMNKIQMSAPGRSNLLRELSVVCCLLLGACAASPEERSGTGGAIGTGGATTGDVGGAGGGAPVVGGGCDPSCAARNGVVIGCERRFMYGVNYAWSRFSGDFGGGTRGVTGNRTNVQNQLADMHANGVDSVRWWIWPNLNASNVLLDADGTPTGIGSTVVADVNSALSLAAQIGVHIQFTLFSFDNFKPDTATLKSIRPIVVDPTKRAALMTLAVAPLIRAVTSSPDATACVGWDVINEPEWAISGSNGYGDPPYTPQTNLQTVTHAEMEAFVAATIAAIRAESSLPITVGSAAAKWPKAWSHLDIDYYTIHIYDWINRGGWSYLRSPADLGLSGKPVVMGEFPLNGLTGPSGVANEIGYDTLVSSWFDNGYAGAMGWSVTDSNFNWAGNKANVKTFADAAGCPAKY
jgi:hypothetical protein